MNEQELKVTCINLAIAAIHSSAAAAEPGEKSAINSDTLQIAKSFYKWIKK